MAIRHLLFKEAIERIQRKGWWRFEMTLLDLNLRETLGQGLEVLVIRVVRLHVAPGLNLVAGIGRVAQHPVKKGTPSKL